MRALESEQSSSQRLSLHYQVQVKKKIWHLEGKETTIHTNVLFIYNTTCPLNCCKDVSQRHRSNSN